MREQIAKTPDWQRHRHINAEWSTRRQKMPRHKRQYGHSVHPGGGPDVYRVGYATEAHDFDPDPRVECAPGIHFFLTRREAEEW